MKKKFSKILGIGLSIALVTSLLIAAIPASALSTPQVAFVTPGDSVISEPNAGYIVTFTVNKQLTGNATREDDIVLTFPEGYMIGASPTGIVSAGPGWVDVGAGPVWDPNPPNLVINFTGNPTFRTITCTINSTSNDIIGESAQVRIQINTGITNPSTPGDYTLTVGTKKTDGTAIEAAVTSATYTIGTPIIFPLAGIVLAKNNAGILMGQSHSINTGIGQAGPGGTVEVGPGTYNEAVDADVAGQTIVATGDPGTVIIGMGGSLTIDAGPVLSTGTTGVTVDGLTIVPNSPVAQAGPMVTVTANGGYAVIKNCDITSGTSSTLGAVNTANITTISNTTIDTTRTGAQIGIVATQKLTVTDSTINVGTGDTAIVSSGGGGGPASSSVKGTTITGSSGKGVMVTAGTISIDATTLMSLSTALDVDAGTVTVKNSVIDTCGAALAGQGDAIEINGGTVTMYNNTIQNSAAANWAVDIAGGAVKIHFNNILNNTKNITTTVAANATHNWWGSAAGPAALSTGGGTNLALIPYLGNSVTQASVSTTGSVIAQTTVGVDAAVLTSTGTAGTAQVLAVAKYSANPELTPPAIMGTGKVLGYFDVYAAGVGGDTVQVKFYVPVTQYTKVYYAGGISGRWVELTPPAAGVNTASGFAYANIGLASTQLNITDLGGTVFALVEDETLAAGPVTTSPLIGAYNVSIDPMFTWNAIGQAIRYEIALSEDPTFTIIEWSYNVDQNFYKVDEPLRYDTTYYWRVRGVLGEPYQEAGQWKTPATPWTTSIFTTESEPPPPTEPIVVQPTKPEVNVEIPPTKITIEPAEQAIPNYMLWIIVAVGAILIIALIVLIVRTRRVV